MFLGWLCCKGCGNQTLRELEYFRSSRLSIARTNFMRCFGLSKRVSYLYSAFLISGLLAACGGGGGGSSPSSPPPITPANSAPVANADSPQSTVVGVQVNLDGSASVDADRDALTFSWTLTSKPTGSAAAINAATTAKPTLTADIAGTYTVSLIVNDGKVNSAPVIVSVTAVIANVAPVANAGAAQSVTIGTVATLTAAASSDANGDPLTYAWTLTAKPEGSVASLSQLSSQNPTLRVDVAGLYVATLIANDGKINSKAASVAIAAVANALTPSQPPSFRAGPMGDLRDATIPPTFGGSSNSNLSLVASTLAVDLSGTGRMDLLIGVGLNPLIPAVKLPMRVLGSSGNGIFSDVTRARFGSGSLPASEGPRVLYTADFNRDGKPDIFCACQGYDGTPPDGETNKLLLSSSAGYLNRSDILPAEKDYTHSAAIADINGDGVLDIYVGNIFGTFKIGPYFLIGKTDATFQQVFSGLPVPVLNLSQKYTYSFLLDLDNDGFPDLILGAEGDTTKSSIVLFNDGKGDFSQRTPYTLPSGPFGNNEIVLFMNTIDANNDGYSDLLMVTTQFQPNYQGGAIRLLINQKNGTFTDETVASLGANSSVRTGFGWNTVQVVDVNNDGLLDFIASSDFGLPGTMGLDYLWINMGNGKFTPVNVSTLSPPPIGKLVALDANGDGKKDLVSVTFFGDGSIHYQTYLNQ